MNLNAVHRRLTSMVHKMVKKTRYLVRDIIRIILRHEISRLALWHCTNDIVSRNISTVMSYKRYCIMQYFIHVCSLKYTVKVE